MKISATYCNPIPEQTQPAYYKATTNKTNGKHLVNPWQRAAKSINVKCCSFDQLMEAITDLYLDGVVSRKALSVFYLDDHLGDKYFDDHGFNTDHNPYRTPADLFGNRNWIKEFELHSKDARDKGDTSRAGKIKDVVSILKKLSKSCRLPISLSV